MPVVPQFPLGSVLFPTMVLPLHVFEPRYRCLIADVLQKDETFGVVLIERGSEIGGNDTRLGFGTLAKIVKAEEFVDGRWSIMAVGTRRFEVTDWLSDDPYPTAEISFIDDADEEHTADRYRHVFVKFSRLMALASEAGIDVGCSVPEVQDPDLASYHMSAMAPLTMLDKYNLLAATSTSERMGLLETHIDTALDAMRFRLSSDATFNE